jgi:hypothetical protein
LETCYHLSICRLADSDEISSDQQTIIDDPKKELTKPIEDILIATMLKLR